MNGQLRAAGARQASASRRLGGPDVASDARRWEVKEVTRYCRYCRELSDGDTC